jgi:hypothetical protein
MQRNAVSFALSHPSYIDDPSTMIDRPRSEIIKDNPIRKGLDAFRASFNSVCEDRRISCSADSLIRLDQDGKTDQSF